jgi:lipopolysaccharide/colanic/teichoic acid biosynthesis glycosyltransferase
MPEHLSPWTQSSCKRLFDLALVLATLPFLIPVFLVIAAAIRLTSSGPVMFLQKRMGRHGHPFTIVKFRTMIHSEDRAHSLITTAVDPRLTPLGSFLRWWKLDELPQLVNVIRGDMSLIGPRPKVFEHQVAELGCRPGITGAATLAFAREEIALASVPKHQLSNYYYDAVLPLKRQLDAEYMARATCLSDLALIVNTALGIWSNYVPCKSSASLELDLNITPVTSTSQIRSQEASSR